jgi:hypothetical protein
VLSQAPLHADGQLNGTNGVSCILEWDIRTGEFSLIEGAIRSATT